MLTCQRRKVQDVQIFLVSLLSARHQRIVCLTKDPPRKQLLSELIIGKRARFTHQVRNDVSVVDALVAGSNPRHFLYLQAAKENSDHIPIDLNSQFHANEPTWYGVPCR